LVQIALDAKIDFGHGPVDLESVQIATNADAGGVGEAAPRAELDRPEGIARPGGHPAACDGVAADIGVHVPESDVGACSCAGEGDRIDLVADDGVLVTEDPANVGDAGAAELDFDFVAGGVGVCEYGARRRKRNRSRAGLQFLYTQSLVNPFAYHRCSYRSKSIVTAMRALTQD